MEFAPIRADFQSLVPTPMKPSPPVIKIIAIALGSGLVADLLTIDELEKRALAVVQKIEDELEAELQGQVESYLEMMNSNR